MNRWTADKWFARSLLILVSSMVLGAGYVFLSNMKDWGAFTKPTDIQVDEPGGAVRDARKVIAIKASNDHAFGDFTEPKDLPGSLRLNGLKYAKVHADHIDLVVARNPDVSLGARIWAVSHRRNEDLPTRYPEIFFFRYNSNSPVSNSNIP